MKIARERVCCFSDLHLGVHQSSYMWLDIALDFAKWTKQQLIDRGIKDIIIPGDVSDDRDAIAVPTLNYLPRFFQIFNDFNIFITVGNHDCYYNRRSDVHSLGALNSWENITVIDKITTITAHEKTITFCPWHSNIDEIPNSDIIFGHFDIQTFKMNGFKICESGVSPKQLLNKANLIVTGHYHLTQDRIYKNGVILYLGSPFELNWGEANSPKGVYILDIPTLKYEFIENNVSPKHKKIRLSELLEIGAVTDEIKKEFRNNIVKFLVDIEIKQAVLDGLISRFHLLKPLEMKIIYEYVKGYDSTDIHFEALGIDVQQDIHEFVQGLDFVENKDLVTQYLQTIYRRAEKVVV